jgi:4-diphosphocytidyl-2-C-methyl-D-erythritol kinase
VLQLFAPAKINLGLQIIGKRNDGYHNIHSLFFPIKSIADILTIELAQSLTLICSQELDIPNENNIVWKAANLLKQRYNIDMGAKISLQKNIPHGAGLGGGSADAAFFIKALNEFDELNLSFGEMHHYAKQIGSDCSFFINNKPALAMQKGELLEPIDLSLKGKYILIIYPNIHISTAMAYSGVVPNADGPSIEDLIKMPIDAWKDHVSNAFESGITKLFPVIGEIKNELYALGAQYASMTGSGSAVYGIFESKPTAINNFSNFTAFETQLN